MIWNKSQVTDELHSVKLLYFICEERILHGYCTSCCGLKFQYMSMESCVYSLEVGIQKCRGREQMPPDAIVNQWEMGVCDYPSVEKFQSLFSHSFNLLRNVPFTVLLPTSWFYFHSITIFPGIKSQINLLHSNPYQRFHIWGNPN